MVTDTPVKRSPGRPSTAETVAKVHARSQAAREHRGRTREKEVDENPSPVPKPQLSVIQSRQKARHFAIRAAVVTPDMERGATKNGELIFYIVQDGLMHQTNPRRKLPPYRPTQKTLYGVGLNDAQISAAFGP